MWRLTKMTMSCVARSFNEFIGLLPFPAWFRSWPALVYSTGTSLTQSVGRACQHQRRMQLCTHHFNEDTAFKWPGIISDSAQLKSVQQLLCRDYLNFIFASNCSQFIFHNVWATFSVTFFLHPFAWRCYMLDVICFGQTGHFERKKITIAIVRNRSLQLTNVEFGCGRNWIKLISMQSNIRINLIPRRGHI